MLGLFLACATPDAEALFRAHDLDAAARAWHGTPAIVASAPMFDVLSRRAATDPALTLQETAWLLDAIALLNATPQARLEEVDIPMDTLAPLGPCIPQHLSAPWLVGIGRSDTAADRDPYEGGALAWDRGRIVGEAHDGPALQALLDGLDKEPPARLTTLALRGGVGTLSLYFARRVDRGAWTLVSASDATQAGDLLRACGLS